MHGAEDAPGSIISFIVCEVYELSCLVPFGGNPATRIFKVQCYLSVRLSYKQNDNPSANVSTAEESDSKAAVGRLSNTARLSDKIMFFRTKNLTQSTKIRTDKLRAARVPLGLAMV